MLGRMFQGSARSELSSDFISNLFGNIFVDLFSVRLFDQVFLWLDGDLGIFIAFINSISSQFIK